MNFTISLIQCIKLIILNTKTRVMKNPLVENIKVERMSQKSLAIYSPLQSQISTPLNRNRCYSSHTLLSKNMIALNNAQLVNKLQQIAKPTKNSQNKNKKNSTQYIQYLEKEVQILKSEMQKQRFFYQRQIKQLKQNIRMKDQLLDQCQKEVYHIKATYNMINKLHRVDLQQQSHNQKSAKSSRSIPIFQTVQTQIIQEQQEQDSFLQAKSKVIQSYKNYQKNQVEKNHQNLFQNKIKKYQSNNSKQKKKKQQQKNKQNQNALTQCFKKKKSEPLKSMTFKQTNLNIELSTDQKQRLVSPIHRLIKKKK